MKRMLIISCIVALALHSPVRAMAALGKTPHQPVHTDTALSLEIARQLVGATALKLYFPKSVKRFYQQNNYQTAWLKPQTPTGPTWQAMMMIDCVLQYGLCYADYHPDELVYDKLHHMMDNPASVGPQQQARFEIMLTDAMINLINNLHFGKLNPDFPGDKIDAGNIAGFDAGIFLASAVGQKNFMSTVETVQPQCEDYVTLQRYMRYRVGLQSGDCYEVPEAEIRKMAINLERLRWAAISAGPYIQINIPTYTLTLTEPDSVYRFKVAIGKPQNPTPQLNSAIRYFTTSPEWKVPNKIFRKEILPKAVAYPDYIENSHFTIYDSRGRYVDPSTAGLARVRTNPGEYHVTQSAGCDNSLGLLVFRFPNIYDIYLHDTPEQKLFARDERAFSHGCVRVERTEELASILLTYDGQGSKIPAVHNAVKHTKRLDFLFKTPIPIKITYITCAIGDEGLVNYKDLYDLDTRLEMALYNATTEFAVVN